MAILIEAISVVVRVDRLLDAFDDDWDDYRQTVPNSTLCADGELARVGFMAPNDTEAYVKILADRGLRYVDDGQAKDIVVAEQLRGPLVRCDWAEFGHIVLGGNDRKRVLACRLKGSTYRQIVLPENWAFEDSLSASYGYVPNESLDKSLSFLRHEDGLDIYWNSLSQAEAYIGRTGRRQ